MMRRTSDDRNKPRRLMFSSDNRSSIVGRSGPRNQDRMGAPKPAFFRHTTSGDNNLSAARFKMYFLFRPRNFKSGGMRAASSSISRFRNGTRTSRLAAIELLSVVMRFRQGRKVFRST